MRQALAPGKYTIILLCLVLFSISLTASARVFATPYSLFADAGGTCSLPDGSSGAYLSDGRTCCPVGYTDATSCIYAKYINPLIAFLAAAIGVVVVVVIVYSGIEYITSGGDPQRTAAAKNRIVSALVGLIAFLLLFAFLRFLVPAGFA